ncbi:MAG: ABC-F family ATP-binding cassette domain-containing protein [Candidatus Paceibacterota bacterium]
MIKVKNISKSYGTLVALNEISFCLEDRWKVALVGPNGTGKTTLLKILAGIEDYDGGSIKYPAKIRIGYLPQDVSFVEEMTILSYIHLVSDFGNKAGSKAAEYNFEHQMKLVLAGFGLGDISLDRELSSLSSGQKTKIALTGLLLKDVDLLLLDEPTNNLDIPSLIWLEDFLKKSHAIYIVVSHDKRFLDNVTSRVLELDWAKHTITAEKGSYSSYLERKLKLIKRQKESYLSQQQEIERLTLEAKKRKEKSAKGTRWTGTDNDKFLRGFKREQAGKSGRGAKTLEKRIEQMEEIEKIEEKIPLNINLEAIHSGAQADINLVDAVARYASGFSVGPVSLEIRYGKRIGLVGENGSGKSTLLKIISGETMPKSGQTSIGSGVRVGNMMQEHNNLPRTEMVMTFLMQKTGLAENEIYNALVKIGFSERNIRGQISELSPGARARLSLTIFSLLSVNVLILDEPTNHLDIEATAVLEELLKKYEGTVILVSHDRYFLEKTRLDSIYLLEHKIIRRISGLQEYTAQAEKDAQKLLKKLAF